MTNMVSINEVSLTAFHHSLLKIYALKKLDVLISVQVNRLLSQNVKMTWILLVVGGSLLHTYPILYYDID